MKVNNLLCHTIILSSLLASNLVHAQDTQAEEQAPKEKRLNLTPSIIDLVKSHGGMNDFRVYVNQVIINTGVDVLSENQYVDRSVHSESEGQLVGERTYKYTAGKIIATSGDDIFVSFSKSCTSKDCSYHFEPNQRGIYTLTTSPEQGEKENSANVSFLGIRVPQIVAPQVKLQYFETDVREFSTVIRDNEGW